MEPTTFRAGDSVSWTLSLPARAPSDGWALHYRLLWPTGTAVDISTTGAGDDYTVSLTAANTADWAAGAATLVSWLTRNTDRETLGQQAVTILPDLTTAANFDSRTRNQKALDAARTALETYLTGGRMHVAEYEIAGRHMKFRSADEIRDLIQFYERECAKERAALAILQGGTPGRILTRF